jgi:hypothetical protein
MPGSRLEIFEGAGHFLHVEQPDRFVEVLRDFIATTEPAISDFDSFRDLVRAGRPVEPPSDESPDDAATGTGGFGPEPHEVRP